MNRTLSLLLTFFVLIALTACEDLSAPAASPDPAAEPTIIGTPEEPSVSSYPTGMRIFIDNPPYAEVLTDEVNEDGTYCQVSVYDGMVTLTMQRLTPAEKTEQDVKARLAGLFPDAMDLMIEPDAAQSDRLSLSAWRLSYESGMYEDARFHVDAYLQADEWDYHFGASAPIDWYEEYESDISRWIDSLYLSEISRED